MTEERRHYQRVGFEAEILMDKDGVSWLCHLVDISLKGMLVVFPDDLNPVADDVFHMEFRLGENAVIEMHVKVKHINEQLVGLEWADIDVDSLTHLRRLLELNLGNIDEIHRELSELG